jgi:cysteine-rich repeat protein
VGCPALPKTVLACAFVLWIAPHAQAKPCRGRYVVHVADGSLLHGATAAVPDAVVLGRRTVALTADCQTTPIRQAVAGGRARVVARLNGCERSALRLRATVSGRCHVLRGTLHARGVRPTAFTAQPSRCGDGVVDRLDGERCDDGNRTDDDGCAGDCRSCAGAPPLASAWEGVQVNVILGYGCLRCHDSGAAIGGLDLRPSSAYAGLVGVPTDAAPGLRFIEPGDHLRSFFWLKLAKATDPAGGDLLPGGGMPLDGALSREELDAVGRWIDAGAPERGAVAGTDALLGRCNPAAFP